MKGYVASKCLLVARCLLLSLGLYAQDASSVTLNVTPSNLNTLLGTNKNLIKNLTLNGDINGDDISTIRSMEKLSVLDMENVNIIGGTEFPVTIGNQNYNVGTIDNQIPIYMFHSLRNITSITIPNSITYIGRQAFENCTSLKEFIVPEGNTTYCSVEGILLSKDKSRLIAYPNAKSQCCVIPDFITSIEEWAFAGCTGLRSVTIGNKATPVIPVCGGSVFDWCSELKEIIVSKENPGFIDIDGVLFNKNKTELVAYPNAKSTTYTIPDNVLSIGRTAFYYCTKLTSVIIPNSVTSIGNKAFGYTSLTSIIIPESVVSIGKMAFCGCTKLTSITIPGSVTSIKEGAFWDCTGLKEIHCKNMRPLKKHMFPFDYMDKKTCKLYVPKGSLAAYKKAKVWNEFKTIIEE